MYHRQLALARGNRDRSMEAAACGALGIAHRLIKKFDKALGNLSNAQIHKISQIFLDISYIFLRLSHSRINSSSGIVRIARRMPSTWAFRSCTYVFRKLHSCC